jgi:NAD+ kinase
MRIAIYGRTFDPNHPEPVGELVQLLNQSSTEIIIEEQWYGLIKDHIRVPHSANTFSVSDGLAGRADFLLSIGGDGTMLDTVTIVRDSGIPVLGINTGKLGFLSGVSLDQLHVAMLALQTGKYILNRRSLIRVHSDKAYFGNMNFALNELSVHRKESPSLIAITLWVNNIFVNSYWADGLIISTPTGSTGYSLSCGGPIIYPQADTFTITPIATHNLTVRPLVIPDSVEVKVSVDAKYGHYTAGLDARYAEIGPGEVLTVSRAPFHLNILQFEEEEFFSTIREKLKWGLDTRN